MKRLTLAFALLLPLAACGGVKDTSATATPAAATASPSADTVDALTGGLKAAETAATIYVHLPLCPQPTGLCRDRGVAAKIGAADTVAHAALTQYRAGQTTYAQAAAALAAMVALIPTK
jgi:hypothetical protein